MMMAHTRKVWLGLAVLVLVAAGAAAQELPLRGRVLRAGSGEAVRGALVELLGPGATARTDAEGRFELPAAQAPVSIRVSAEGHETRTVTAAGEGGAARADILIELETRALRIHEAVVVSASRSEERSFDAPRSMSVVGASDLQRHQPRSTPEALWQTAGVFVQKTNHGGGSPFVRGLVGNQVLVLVDGIRLNNSTFRYGPNQYLATIDPGQIDRIEVLRGSGSVLHGSDAIGGVINIITRTPALSAGRTQVSGSASAKLMSAGMEQSGRFDVELSGDRAALAGGFSVRNYGDLLAGGSLGVEAPSGYREVNGDGKALLRLGSKSLLTLAGQHVHQDDVPRFDQVQRGYSRYSFAPQVRSLGYARLQAFTPFRGFEQIDVVASAQKTRERRERQRAGAAVLTVEQDDVRMVGLTIQGRSSLAPWWSIITGFDFYRDHVGSWRKDIDSAHATTESRRGLYPDGATAGSLAAFAHSTMRLGGFSVESGARFSRYTVNASDVVFGELEIAPSAWVGHAAVSWKPGDVATLFASVSQAFRAPNIDDLSTLGGFDYGIEIPSTDLAPERSLGVEAGVKARTNRLAASIAVFRSSLKDLIDRARASYNGSEFLEGHRVYQRGNVGAAYVQGFELEAEWQAAAPAVIFGHLSYTYGQQTTAGQPMRRIPPLNGVIGVHTELPRGRAWLEGRLQFAGKQERLSSGDLDDYRIPRGGTPGWQVLDVHLGVPLNRWLELNAGLQNLLNEAYRTHGSGIDGYGRSAWIATHLRF